MNLPQTICQAFNLPPRGSFPGHRAKPTVAGKGKMKIWRTKLRGSEFKVTRFDDALPSGSALDNPERLVDYLGPSWPRV